MVIKSADRVQETSTTTGTGTIDLNGANGGFQTFVDGVGSGNTCYYAILDVSAWEVGEGTVTSGSPDTLSRDVVHASSDSGALLTLDAGTKEVYVTIPASRAESIVRENLILGGNFDINPWQREVLFTAVASGTVTADRFIYNTNSGTPFTIRKFADAPTATEAGLQLTNCLELDVVSLKGAAGAGDFDEILYPMEGYDWAQIADGIFTIAFWHKHTVTGIYCISLRNSGDDRSYVAEYTQNTTDTWERAIIQIAVAPTAGTWNYDTGRGLALAFAFRTGTTFQGTVNTWNSSHVKATSNQVNGLDSASNFCRLDDIRCTVGVGNPQIEPRTVGRELALCQRYYEKSYDSGTYADAATFAGSIRNIVQTTTDMAQSIFCPFKVTKRIVPTITAYSPQFSPRINLMTIGNSNEAVATISGTAASHQNCFISTSATHPEIVGSVRAVHFTAEAELA